MSPSRINLDAFDDCFLQIKGCLKRQDRANIFELYAILNIGLQNPTKIDRRTCFILRDRLTVFRDSAIFSCYRIFAISWLVCVTLMEISTEKKPHLEIRSGIFLYEFVKGLNRAKRLIKFYVSHPTVVAAKKIKMQQCF